MSLTRFAPQRFGLCVSQAQQHVGEGDIYFLNKHRTLPGEIHERELSMDKKHSVELVTGGYFMAGEVHSFPWKRR